MIWMVAALSSFVARALFTRQAEFPEERREPRILAQRIGPWIASQIDQVVAPVVIGLIEPAKSLVFIAEPDLHQRRIEWRDVATS